MKLKLPALLLLAATPIIEAGVINLFDKESAASNPDRTTIKARKGQDSPDRIIMSAPMDRINAME